MEGTACPRVQAASLASASLENDTMERNSQKQSDALMGLTNRLSSYKPRKTSSSQEERRICLLQDQKRLREEAFNRGRDVVDKLHKYLNKGKRYLHGKRSKIYKNRLMLSEWFLEIPCDLESNWTMVPCPVGKRVLVVAARNITVGFSKDGRVLGCFRSLLPGGYPNSHPSSSVTILDCIWNRKNLSYYVLDVLAWNTQPLVNCDTEFRFFWLKSQLSELEGISEVSADNIHPFHFLPRFPCDRETLEIAVASHPLVKGFGITIDGLLFYHLKTDYRAGETPLVGWLKPFMLPEVLQMPVSEELMNERPEIYQGYRQYMNDYDEKLKAKKDRRRKKRVEKMDLGDTSNESREDIRSGDDENGMDTHEISAGDDEEFEETAKVLVVSDSEEIEAD